MIIAVTVALLFNSQAAVAAWYTCNINSIGGNGDTTLVKLTDTASNKAWSGSRYFTIPKAHKNYYLALILTALSQGKKVKISLKTIKSKSTIKTLYINN